MLKNTLKITAVIAGIVLAIVVIYVSYVFLSYNRIPDNQPLKVEGRASKTPMQTGKEYTIITQNCGFGAYSPDFTFFMDGGTQSWAKSRDSVISNTDMAAAELMSFDPDLILLQEVDTDSTRSYHVDQVARFSDFFKDYSRVFALNYHSAFLMYPITQPHGKSNSGIVTYSRPEISSAVRRQLPVSSGFNKILDLDRCYTVSHIPTDAGNELVLYNLHASAYGGSAKIRTAQLTMLTGDMLSEYEKGNYVICGGDFNHDFTGNSGIILGNSTDGLGWAQPFPKELLPEGFSQCLDYNDDTLVATCRNCDVPYGPDCLTVVVDGFIISDNVSCTELHNIDAGFSYSDHNPVVMKFKLD